MDPLKNTKSLIISGAVTSGKTLLALELNKQLNIKLLSEDTIGNYYKILDSINPYSYPEALYEHCWIYKKQFLFKHLYETNILVVLSVLPELLKANYESRLSKLPKGDFINMDPVKQQEEILSDISSITKSFSDDNNKILVLQINSIDDYVVAKEYILKEYSKFKYQQ